MGEGLFGSERKLPGGLYLQLSIVTIEISIMRLPKPVLEAFIAPLDIQCRWTAHWIEGGAADPNLLRPRRD